MEEIRWSKWVKKSILGVFFCGKKWVRGEKESKKSKFWSFWVKIWILGGKNKFGGEIWIFWGKIWILGAQPVDFLRREIIYLMPKMMFSSEVKYWIQAVLGWVEIVIFWFSSPEYDIKNKNMDFFFPGEKLGKKGEKNQKRAFMGKRRRKKGFGR